MLVKDLMTRFVITVSPEDPLSYVAKIFKEERISGMPVTDDNGALLGVITLTDLLRMLQRLYRWKVLEKTNNEPLFAQMFEQEKNKAKVEYVMTHDVLTIKEEDNIEEAIRIMTEHKVHTIPVMDGGRLVGVIGKRDVI